MIFCAERNPLWLPERPSTFSTQQKNRFKSSSPILADLSGKRTFHARHYADTAMVGQLGAYATASVSICNQAMFLITGAVLAMGTGITALVARAIGADDIPLARKLTRQAVMLSLYLGVPLCALYGSLSHLLPVWLGGEPDVVAHATTYNLIVACGRPFSMLSMVLGSVFRGARATPKHRCG
jgi:Na+-driven multidrug efflux pump